MSSVGAAKSRMVGLALVLAPVAVGLDAATARAAYSGRNGAIAFELYSDSHFSDVGAESKSDVVMTYSKTIAACDDSSGSLSCRFGPPSYSPDGKTIVASRLGGTSTGSTMMLVGANGADQRSLAPQTSDDEHPSFLPSGIALVFDGKTSTTPGVNLSTVSAGGAGLHQLTQTGGSSPAPCANGAIAFVKRGDIYLLSRDQRSQRRLTFRGGSDPSCSPDSRQIAFVRRGDVYTIASNGKRVRRFTGRTTHRRGYSPPGSAYSPTFSPDGRQIAFLTSYDDPSANGSDNVLEFINLRKGRIRAGPVIGGSSCYSGDCSVSTSSGISWQAHTSR